MTHNLSLSEIMANTYNYAHNVIHGIYLQPHQKRNQYPDRGLPLLTARLLFNSRLLVREDTRKAYPERRFIGYNTIDGRLMAVVFLRASG